MAGKNTAVFGIFRNVEQAERAVDTLIAEGFSDAYVSVLMPDRESSRAFAHEKHTKAPEGATTGVAAGGAIGVPWACWQELVRWRYLGWGRSSRRDRLWVRLRASPRAVQSAAWLAPWSAWAFLSTKPSGTKGTSEPVAFFCLCTARHQKRSPLQRIC